MAERAGVSIATVSRALNDKGDVSGPTRERVREVARSVGYSPDPAARSLARQKTRLVAIIVGDNAGHRDLSLIFFGRVLDGDLAAALRSRATTRSCSSRATSASTTASTPRS